MVVEVGVPPAAVAPGVLGSRGGTGNSVNPRPWICSGVKVREASWFMEGGEFGDGEIVSSRLSVPSTGTPVLVLPTFACGWV